MTKGDKRLRKGSSTGKSIRNQQMIAENATGKSVTDLAEQYGMSRQNASKILNSTEAKELLKLYEYRLQQLGTKSIDTLEYTLDNVSEFGMAGAASQNARAILKSIGALKEKIDLSHTFPKPTVIRKRDGTELVLGTSQEKTDEEEEQ